jgi:uncharacterized protein YbjT (DUF2867 family)
MVSSTYKILITGATGNVGMAILNAIQKQNISLNIITGVRDLTTDSKKLASYKVSFEQFDFMNAATYKPALQNCDILFLLRPPQIADTKNIFEPLIQSAKDNGVKHIIFLSVQGVEKSSIIPHHKIEKQIVASGIPYTFLRPAYFMQNFTTTLHNDLVNKRLIYLPAGQAKFTLVDVADIGNVAATILKNVELHKNKIYELTTTTKLTFAQMAQQLSRGLGIEITYTSPSLINFFITKQKEKLPVGYIFVLIMLHYFPRFQKEPAVTDCIKKITGIEALEFDQFINNNKTLLL